MSDAQDSTVSEGALNYFSASRSFALSIVSILPLIVLYHCGIVQSGYPVRNLAEIWLQGPLELVGLHAAHILNIALIIALVAVLWRSEVKQSAGLFVIALMMLEGMFYAMLLYKGGDVVARAVHEQASRVFFAIEMERFAPLLLALGAGVYEELLFRLLLVGGGVLLFTRVFLWNRALSTTVALVASGVLFALAHHIGPMSDDFDSYVFVFRAVSGVLLGLIYVFRGLGIAVWTHATYNALVVIAMSGAATSA